jgi:hypothetical protein
MQTLQQAAEAPSAVSERAYRRVRQSSKARADSDCRASRRSGRMEGVRVTSVRISSNQRPAFKPISRRRAPIRRAPTGANGLRFGLCHAPASAAPPPLSRTVAAPSNPAAWTSSSENPGAQHNVGERGGPSPTNATASARGGRATAATAAAPAASAGRRPAGVQFPARRSPPARAV